METVILRLPKLRRPRLRLGRAVLRLALWSTPLLLVAGVHLEGRRAAERTAVAEAGALLVAGDAAGARTVLAALGGASQATAEVRAGLTIADVLAGATPPPASEPILGTDSVFDASPFPLALAARTAFERGDFRAALALSRLADGFAKPAVPLTTAAALIESGRSHEARALRLSAAALPGALARRVAHHIATPQEQRGVLLRDRLGEPLGTVEDGVLALWRGVAPETMPRAVAELSDADAGAGSLRLSLDRELSDVALDALAGYRGSVVLIDPYTGEILAAVSDRHTLAAGGTPAFEQLREPASISKLITATAALRAGVDPDRELARMRCRGHETYGGQVLYCPHIAGPLRGLDRAMAVSCNVAFASLGVEVGRRGVVDELRRYGFDGRLGAFPAGHIVQAHGNARQLADMSIGLEATDITPLHAALVAAVMANDGVMPVPHLVLSEDGRLGLHPRPRPLPAGQRVIEPEWLPEMRRAMTAVVENGTARNVAPRSFPVAMKTGTASHPRYGFHVNYIGIGPMPHARIAFCVRITDQPTSRKVRAAARQVTESLLFRLGYVSARRGWTREPYPEIRRPAPLPDVDVLVADSLRRPAPRPPSTGSVTSAR